MIFSPPSFFFANLIFLNIARTSGCPPPAASFATTSSNFFDEVTLNLCTLICLLPISSPIQFRKTSPAVYPHFLRAVAPDRRSPARACCLILLGFFLRCHPDRGRLLADEGPASYLFFPAM